MNQDEKVGPPWIEQLSRSSGWRVMTRKVADIIVAGAGVKAF